MEVAKSGLQTLLLRNVTCKDVWKPDEGLKTGSGACEYCEAALEWSVLHVHSHVMRPGLDRTGSAL